MKKRILTGWTFARILYLVIGTLLIIQSAMNKEWIGVFVGSYFTSMGLFSIGCASGNCYGGNCAVESELKIKADPIVELHDIKKN